MTEVADINEGIKTSKREVSRDDLVDMEKAISSVEGAFVGDSKTCPLTHKFSDKMYVREIFIPEGTLLVGKIHKHDHPNFLLKGVVQVVTEDKGGEILEAPLSMISPPGTKRGLLALTDLVWTTVHYNPTNTQDLDELEGFIIAKDYEDYERFLKKENKVVRKIKNKLIKMLSI